MISWALFCELAKVVELGDLNHIPATWPLKALVPMAINKNKDLIRRLYAEVVSAGNTARVGEFVSEDYLDHNAEGAGRGPGVLRAHIEAVRRTFPDFRLRIEDVVAEGDRVATRVTAQGTHQGRWMSIEPTGALVELKGINIDRVVDGKLVEHWGEADTIGMLRQMGRDPFAGSSSR